MENNTTKIDINKLENITSALFSKLKENIGSEIEISKDFYWDGIADLIHHSRSYDIFCSLLDYAKKNKKISSILFYFFFY